MPAARTTGLWKLHLKGHFDLQTSSLIDVKPGSSNLYIPFNIPTLTHLEICPSINSTVDIHLILDSAVRLQHLFIQSHGSFVDSINDEQLSSNDSSTATGLRKERRIHQSLLTLKIQHLKMKREELEGIAARCPNLIELQSLCNPGNLWRERPPIQQQQQHVGANVSSTGPQEGPSQENQESKKSLVRTLATSCPNIQRFHIGLQQGGFPLQSIRETMTSFPKLETLGIPAWDCSKVTMETLKAAQDNPRSLATSGAFLTKLCIMNVCSSEKISQAIHDYLSWTPHLKEFYAYNTTLYVEQIQMQTQTQTATLQKRDHAVPHSLAQGTSPIVSNNGLEGFFVNQDGTRHSHGISHSRLQHQHIPETGSSLIPDAAAAIADDNHAIYLSHPAFITVSQQQRPRQWACTQLEKLVVRFARLPWRNLSEPPKSSKDTFAFLIPLQNLKYLCIKEGLMLETGREYDALRQMKGLEEVVFTTCYPIPIKPRDMASWMTTGAEKGPGMVTEEKDKDKGKEVRALKRVIVRRQKANAVLDKEMEEWFREHRPDVRFAYETTDGCEEEYSFD
ncbi:hypothetical protein BGX28_009683 [Mortierella sp. GBA30]|nr:hypothetical protein BGX28_009683 [Mortierella sp. GBA30]